MKFIICSFVLLVCMQIEVKAFSSPENCVSETMQNFKHVRSPYSGDFFLENYHTKRALNTMCLIYVPHKLHKVLALVDKNTCANDQRPTTAEFEAMIYNNYLQLLDRLVMYQGQFGGVIPSSFSQSADYAISQIVTVIESTTQRLAWTCLHKSPADVRSA